MNTITAKQLIEIETSLEELRRRVFPGLMVLRKPLSASAILLLRLTYEQYAEHRGPIMISELAAKLGVSDSAISQTLTLLRKRHLVSRKKSKQNKKQTYYTITRTGVKIIKALNNYSVTTHRLDDLFAFLGPKDTENFLDLMAKIDTYLDKG